MPAFYDYETCSEVIKQLVLCLFTFDCLGHPISYFLFCFGNWIFPFLSCKFSLKHMFDLFENTLFLSSLVMFLLAQYLPQRWWGSRCHDMYGHETCSTANHGGNWVVESCWRLVLASWCWMFWIFFVFNFLLSDFCVKYRMLVVLIGSNSEKEPRNVLQYQEKSSRWVFYGLKISIFLAETQWWYPV